MCAASSPVSSHRAARWSPALAVGLCALALGTQAQTAPPAPAPAADSAATSSERIERITHEDKLSRIEELRVGGQTRSISVQPKSGAPGYEIAPAVGSDAVDGKPAGNAGKSRWRILNF